MGVFVAEHHHAYGVDVGAFMMRETDVPLSDEQVADVLGWDYEPDKEEGIEFHFCGYIGGPLKTRLNRVS
jgi:hypothetical protein